VELNPILYVSLTAFENLQEKKAGSQYPIPDCWNLVLAFY